jgi:hypothetical protein
MKLYNLPRFTWFTLDDDTKAPPDIGGYAPGVKLKLDHIDGMYSYCLDEDGNVFHPVAWAEVTPCPTT